MLANVKQMIPEIKVNLMKNYCDVMVSRGQRIHLVSSGQRIRFQLSSNPTEIYLQFLAQ